MTSATLGPTVFPTAAHIQMWRQFQLEDLRQGRTAEQSAFTAEQQSTLKTMGLGAVIVPGNNEGGGWTVERCLEYVAYVLETVKVHPEPALKAFVEARGLTMPESKTGWLPVLARLQDAAWWGRQLGKRNTRRAEYARMKDDKVREYCSDDLYVEMVKRRRRLADWMKRAELVDKDTGESVPMSVMAASGISNNEIRLAELKTRARGLDEYSLWHGHSGRFVTLTAPGSFHRTVKPKDQPRRQNPSWNGMDPVEVQQYMSKCFARWRAHMKRHKIRFYGFRTLEPHVDGCPHWHVIVFFETTKQAKIGITALRKYYLQTEGDAPGAQQFRVKTKTINPFKGGAAAYLMKYICKNVDGSGVGGMTDRDGEMVTADAATGSDRVRSWAAGWGRRQFQMFGLPPVGIWRELRRIRDIKDVPEELVMLWTFADAGEWFQYMMEYDRLIAEGAAPELVKRAFTDDMAALKEIYGSYAAVPDSVMGNLKTLSKYGEPRKLVMGLSVPGRCTLLTRRYRNWEIKVTPAEPTPATPEALIQADAVFEYHRTGRVNWDELVEKAHDIGAWGWARPQGPPTLDLWQ